MPNLVLDALPMTVDRAVTITSSLNLWVFPAEDPHL